MDAFDPELLRLKMPSPARGTLTYTFEESSNRTEPKNLTVVCLHGLPGSVRDFRYLAPELCAQGFDVVRLNLPGFGGTPAHIWRAHDMTHRAAFVAYCVERLGLSDVVVLGHSLGGGLAMMSAHMIERLGGEGKTRAQVRGLALVNSMGITRHRGLSVPEQFSQLLKHVVRVGPLSERIVKRFYALYLKLGFKERDLVDEKGEFNADRVALFSEIVGGLEFAQLRSAVRQLRCPVVMYSSQNDPLIEPEISHTLFAHFPDAVRARHVQKNEGGHFLQKSAAADIAESCRLAFSHSGGGPGVL